MLESSFRPEAFPSPGWHTWLVCISGGKQEARINFSRDYPADWANDERERKGCQGRIGTAKGATAEASAKRTLVAGEADATGFDGFGEAAANWAEDESRDVALGLEREV